MEFRIRNRGLVSSRPRSGTFVVTAKCARTTAGGVHPFTKGILRLTKLAMLSLDDSEVILIEHETSRRCCNQRNPAAVPKTMSWKDTNEGIGREQLSQRL